MPRLTRTVLALLLACCLPAQAQWAWKDAAGRPVYSDQPPPASVPPGRIVKAPRNADLQRGQAPATPAAMPAPVPSLAERNAAYEERRRAATAQAARQADERQAVAARAAACENARNNQRALDSGARIGRFDANGERTFLDDAQRAGESKRNAAQLAEHCR